MSRNSLKHGLASGALLIPGEDPAAFEALLHELLEEHQPANSTEELLIKDMAQSWRLAQRAIRLQNDCFSENGVDAHRFSLFLRYQTTHDRAFYKALHTLLRLQKERRQSELRFVSQTALEPVEIQNRDRQGPAFGFVSQNLPVCPPPTAQKSAEAA